MALPVVGGADATVQKGKDARRRRVPRPQEGGRQPQDRRGEGEAREDRAALQPGPHRPREDSLPSQFYLSVDVSLPGLAILSSRQTDERRIQMGKLIATTQATVDGVIDPVGEWVQADGDHADYSFERQARSSGLVLGRKTYEGLAGYWPSQSGQGADMVNPMPKYVGSNSLSGDLEWNATLLEGALEDSIPKLKDEVGGDLFMHGSGEFPYGPFRKGPVAG